MTIQYMTPIGDWACSCDKPENCPSAALLPAPADPDGFHGADGMRWTGKAWVDDPSSSERAFAVMWPDEALAQEREAMTCTRTQARKALGRDMWTAISAYVEASGDWDLQSDFEAGEWHRTNANLVAMATAAPFSMGDDQLDGLFRLAATK